MSAAEIESALSQLTELTAAGDTKRAAALLSAAQRAAPANPDFAVRQLELCLQANQLVCAAHSARALLRHAPAEHPDMCRFLASARAFGARAAGLRWCPPDEPCTRSVANASVDGSVVAATGASLDEGHMWRAENFISTLKMLLADESLWRGRTGRTLLNHAVMQQMQARAIAQLARAARHICNTHSAATLCVRAQGNAEVAADLYDSALQLLPSAAHGYANLAMLERGSRGRARLERALALEPDGPDSGTWWAELGSIHWMHGQPKLARHAVRRALKLQPHSSFGYALSAELHSALLPASSPPPPRAPLQSPVDVGHTQPPQLLLLALLLCWLTCSPVPMPPFAALKHDFGSAAAAAAASASIQQQHAPQLPACAQWPAVLPRVPALWAAPGQQSLAMSYRELVVGCSSTLIKCTGGGWHDRQHLPAAPSKLPFPNRHFDELHWCPDADAAGCDGPAETCVGAATALGWPEALRVLLPTALVQVHAHLPAPPLVSLQRLALGDAPSSCPAFHLYQSME